MPARASSKREREFKQLEQRFRQEHRYTGREEEVAARIVNKQRTQYGETKAELEKDRTGQSPDRSLPIENYQQLTIAQIARHLPSLSRTERKKIRQYEMRNKQRKGLLEKLDRLLQG